MTPRTQALPRATRTRCLRGVDMESPISATRRSFDAGELCASKQILRLIPKEWESAFLTLYPYRPIEKNERAAKNP